MSFLTDYLLYNSGNECSRKYHVWSAFATLAASAGRRVFVDHGYFTIYPNLYICLVGEQGLRKSTAKDIARDLFIEALPDYPVGPSVTSREDIVKRMSEDEWERVYTNEQGAVVKWKPIVFFVNELKNFISINPSGMIDFLTDIYDRRIFDASTIKHNLQTIENPCVNILACETPNWIISRLKMNIITGGFSRRMIYIYETEENIRITFPVPSPEGAQARLRCIKHLQKVSKIVGKFQWTKEAKAYFDYWYQHLIYPDDPVMAGYFRSKNTLTLKLAMLHALSEEEPKLFLTKQHLELALADEEDIETNMPKLSIAAGRNELAGPQQEILNLLEKNDGWLPERKILSLTDKDLNPTEKASVLRNLKEMQKIFVFVHRYPTDKDAERLVMATQEKYLRLTKVKQSVQT